MLSHPPHPSRHLTRFRSGHPMQTSLRDGISDTASTAESDRTSASSSCDVISTDRQQPRIPSAHRHSRHDLTGRGRLTLRGMCGTASRYESDTGADPEAGVSSSMSSMTGVPVLCRRGRGL